jgi:hypothetical protein
MNTNHVAPVQTPGTPSDFLGTALDSEVITGTAESLAEQVTADRLTKLTNRGRIALARGVEANLEAGRAYNALKELFRHGAWIPFLACQAAQFGLSIRTIQGYMAQAKLADAQTKNAESALFAPATDAWAQAITGAGNLAKQAVANATTNGPEAPLPDSRKCKKGKGSKVRLDGNYKLRLWLTADQQDAANELMASHNWKSAELTIIAMLEQLFVQHGIFNPPQAAATAELPLTAEANNDEHDVDKNLIPEEFEYEDVAA